MTPPKRWDVLNSSSEANTASRTVSTGLAGFLVSFIGCVIGTYTAPPTDEKTLIHFYVTVRPWGYWHPVAKKAQQIYPELERNSSFKRDMFNVFIGIVWQSCLTVLPMYLAVRNHLGLAVTVLLIIITSLILRYTWYKPLCAEEESYEKYMKKLGFDEK